ncbi:MAG: sugar transferase [Bacilli bacterium]|jgi:lipopolysaccharide/colanic/teichoic acid biosynthesis glycosyltransferase
MFKKRQKIYLVIKRIIDLVGSILGILILSPLLLIIAIITKISSRGPVLFKQKRVGQYNKIFTLYKFRSMKIIYDQNGDLKSDEARLTKFGVFLRRTSLDELPQLFNILLGQMTIIGPRPKTIFETLLMKDTKFVYRMAIKPGLSSWSVIHGRNNISNDQALAYDLEHIALYSFPLDFKIFFKTIKLVFKGSGIKTEGHATFFHLADFLLEKNIKSEDEIAEIKKQAVETELNKLKYIPLGISKKEFREKCLEIQKNSKNKQYSSDCSWE